MKYLLIVIVVAVIFASIFNINRSEITKQCLNMKKVDTDSTHHSVGFTGEYEKSHGIIYCLDKNGVTYPLRIKNDY